MFRRGAFLVFALAALVTVPAATPAASDGSFFVGFTEDLPKSIGVEAVAPATDLGAGAFRITLMWNPGQTQLADADATQLDRAVSAAGGMRVVLAVYADAGSKAPRDEPARQQFCTYAADALARSPAIRDVVVWNEPNKSFFWAVQAGAPAAYEALLASCWDVLHSARADVNVIGLALGSNGNDNSVSTSPGNFIRQVGEAYRASGRSRPILDTVGYHPYGLDAAERPWRKHIQSKVVAMGDWNKLMYNLWQAFDGTAQSLPGEAGVSIWYLEVGFQTSVDATKTSAYAGAENVAVIPDDAGGEPDSPAPAETSPAPDQRTQALDAIHLAACQPSVGAYFNFLLMDEPALGGWQSGAYWADRTPKDSLPAFRQAIAEATSASVDCGVLKGGRPSADYMPPTAPTSLQGAAQPDPLRVELSWAAASDDASALGYRVYRNGAHVGTTSTTSWTNVAVASATTYTYTVRALDSAGNLGDASAPVTITTPDVTPPATPVELTATALTDPPRVELAWAASSDNVGVAGYDVYRDGVLLGTTAVTALTDAAVAGTTTYTYSVVAFDGAGNRSAAATATVTTPDLTSPSAPPGLTATGLAGPSRVELSWGASADDVGVAAYEVYRDGALLATVSALAYTDAAVVPGATYGYAVRALDAAGNASAETQTSATVPDTVVPSPPTALTGESLTGPVRVRLTWAASTDNVAVTAYRVYRNGVRIATTSGRTYTDYAVARSTKYRYHVTAVDAAANESAASASVWVTTRRR